MIIGIIIRALFLALSIIYISCSGGEGDSLLSPSYSNSQCVYDFEPVYLDTVSNYSPGSDANSSYTDPAKAVDGVKGAGLYEGSLDVVSLGTDGIIVLSSSKYRIVNGDGIDFKVFENVFKYKNEDYYYMEVATVWVSTSSTMPDPLDDSLWIQFPVSYDPSYPPGDPRRFAKGFAGVNPVFLNDDCYRIDPKLDEAGGDGFDLQVLVDNGLISPTDSVYYIRLKDGGTTYDEGHSCCTPFDFDLDGIAIINYEPK